MLAKELVSTLIPTVTGTDTVGQVIKWMEKFRVSHLPLTDKKDYLGLLAEGDILEYSDQCQLKDVRTMNILNVSVVEDQHIYEVIDLISRYELSLLPVVTPEKKLVGSITLLPLIKSLGSLTAAGQPGAVLVLSLAVQDYSPTMLSRIIEENNAKIISLYLVPDQNGHDVTITIKVNTQETSSILRSFDRYGYTVKSSFMTSSQLDDFYRSRYEEFMNYMNI